MKTALSVCAALLLAACGGGGGDGDAAAPTGPLAAVTLTSANQAAVTGVAVDVTTGSVALLEIGLVPVGVQATTTPAVPSRRVLSRLTTDVMQRIAGIKSSPAMVTGVVTVENCGSDPSFGTFSFDDFGTTTSGRATFSNCRFSTDGSVNGIMNLSGMAVSASSASGTVDLSLSYVEQGLSPATLTGGFTFSIVGLDTMNRIGTMTGTRLSSVEGTQRQDISAFDFRFEFDENTGVSTDTASFTVSDATIAGSFTFATVTPFTTTANTLYPSAGVGLVTGAASTALRITALGNEHAAQDSQVSIERSSDSGASFGAATLTTWDAL